MQRTKPKIGSYLLFLASVVAVVGIFISVAETQRNAVELADYCANPSLEKFQTKLACVGQSRP